MCLRPGPSRHARRAGSQRVRWSTAADVTPSMAVKVTPSIFSYQTFVFKCRKAAAGLSDAEDSVCVCVCGARGFEALVLSAAFGCLCIRTGASLPASQIQLVSFLCCMCVYIRQTGLEVGLFCCPEGSRCMAVVLQLLCTGTSR